MMNVIHPAKPGLLRQICEKFIARKTGCFFFCAVLLTFFTSLTVSAQDHTLVVDHLFTYKNPIVNYSIHVKGKVPITEVWEGVTYIWGIGEKKITAPASTFTGTGTVTVKGSGNIDTDQKFKVKKLNYDTSMTVTINGKTNYIRAVDKYGSKMFVNLEIQENWNSDLVWDIETSDPENDALRLKLLKAIIPRQIPASPHTGRTIEFEKSFFENTTYEYRTSNAEGDFRWRYTLCWPSSTIQQNKKDVNPDNEQLNYADPRPKDIIPPPIARLGPPLDQIPWELIDLDK